MAIQIRVNSKFPAQVLGGAGLSLTKSGGVYTVALAFDELTALPSIAAGDRDNIFIPTYNSDGTPTYANVSVDVLLTTISAGLDATLISIAALTPTTDQGIYFTAADTAATYSLTAFARTLLDDATAAIARGTLGLAVSSTDNAIVRFDSTAGITQTSLALIDDSGNLCPVTTDVGALGTSLLNWADLFLDSGAVINFDSGDVTITHSANTLAFAGATAYTFDAALSGLTTLTLSSFIDLTEQSAPANPAANHLRLYSKDVAGDTHLFTIDSAGSEVDITIGGSGSSASSQAEQETATDTTTFVSPGRQHFHPSALKFWGFTTYSGGTPTQQVSYNITSIADTNLGDLTVTIATDNSTDNYPIFLGRAVGSSGNENTRYASQAAGSFRVVHEVADGSGGADPTSVSYGGPGDHA